MSKTSRLVRVSILLVFVLVSAAFVSTAFAMTVSFNGTISVPGETDTYIVALTAGDAVTATAICTEVSPGNRPLDPTLEVLSPSGVSIAFDDDSGSPCNAYNTAVVNFVAPVAGNYTFLVRGFVGLGYETGPYVLQITGTSIVVISGGGDDNPFTDGRINPHRHAPAVFYCRAGGAFEVYSIRGQSVLLVSGDDMTAAENGSDIATFGALTLSRLEDGRYQVLAGLPDAKGYLFIWNGCPARRSETYTIDPASAAPVLFETRNY